MMSRSEDIRMWKHRLRYARMRRQAALAKRFCARKDKSEVGVARCTAWLEREKARVEEAIVELEAYGITFTRWRR